jgi:Glycosyl hydrolase catalytic core
MYRQFRFASLALFATILTVVVTAWATPAVITVDTVAVDAQLITWANAQEGIPLLGVAAGDLGRYQIPSNWPTLFRAGAHVAGITETLGQIGLPLKMHANWLSMKRGAANTVGTLPLSNTAAATCLTNLAPRMNWFINYRVTPWGTATSTGGYGVPMTDPGPDTQYETNGNTPAINIPAGLQFVPMFIDGSHVNTNELNWAAPYAAASHAIVTFNEPYGEGAMTVAQAIAVWPQIQTLAAANNARIVAPSIGYATGNAAATWLSDFMTQLAANGYHVDILNFHDTLGAFDGSAGAPGQIQGFFVNLDAMHAAYPTYPIWITEWQYFVANDETVQGRPQLLYGTDGIIAGIEARQWVEREAYWPLGSDPSRPGGAVYDTLSLCDATGALTATGTHYDSLSHRAISN